MSKQNSWSEIEKAVQILSMCQAYTQSHNIPDEQWLEYTSILITLLKRELPPSIKKVVVAMLDICPHNGGDRSTCDKCWEETIAWL